MKEKGKYTIVVVSALVMLVSILGYTYSFFSARLTEVNKTETKIKTNELGIKFTGQTEISCTNMVPGNKCIKTFKVENTSSVKTFYNIYMEKITNEFNEDLVYTLTDESGTVVSETALPTTQTTKTYLKNNIELEVNGIKNYTLTIEFKYTEEDQNDYQGAEFRATVGIDTVQNITPPVTNPSGTLCKRATELHEETCSPNSQYNYCRGAAREQDSTITYGNLGTRGTLASGDAFDCDVNGDGVYDKDTERFYYVSDYYNTTTKQFETDTAVLIYYSNTTSGLPDNSETSGTAYNISGSSVLGPETAKAKLPSASQWSNVSLKNSERAILNMELNNQVELTTLPTGYNYSLYAARLPIYKEITEACGESYSGSNMYRLKNCEYLLENTNYSNSTIKSYGYWLDTPTIYNGKVLRVDSTYANVYDINANSQGGADGYYGYGVRPVIEVPIANIEV